MSPTKKAVAQPEQNAQHLIVDFSDSTKQIIVDLTNAILSQKAPIITLKSVDSTVLESLVQGLSKGANLQTRNVAPAPTPAPAPALTPTPTPTPTPATSLTEIRNMVNAKVMEQKTNAIVALLNDYNAKNVAALDPSDFDAFYTQLKTL